MESKTNRIAFFGLLAGITVLFFFLTASFLLAVFWAIVLAIVFGPLNLRIRKIIPNLKLATLTSLITIILIIGIPSFFAGNLILREVQSAYEKTQTQEFQDNTLALSQTLSRYEQLTPVVHYIETLREETASITRRVFDFLLQNVVTVGENLVRSLLFVFVLLYVLFFILKDGERLKHSFVQSLPFSNEHTHKLFKKFSSITRATLKGVFFVGIVEGLIATGIFYIVGLPSPALWGLAVLLASIVPGIGTGIVWFPVTAYLVLGGMYWQAFLVLGIGIATVVVVDNILRPRMIGRDTKLPDAFILVSTFGGIGLFGASGLILGPLIAGFFVAMWEIFRLEYKQ